MISRLKWAGLLGASAIGMFGFALPASASTLAYEVTNARGFGTLDLASGAFTLLGVSQTQLSGLGVGTDGRLYGGEYRGSNFYRVNPLNGVLTLIGDSGINFGDTGSTLTGLFGLSTDNSLYSINLATAAATLVGGLGGQFGNFNGTIGMSTNSNELYATHNASLFAVNTNTGAATFVGNGSQSFAALVTEHGTLYGGTGTSVYTVDRSTAQDTFSANEGMSAYSSFFGLAPDAAGGVPEPATWAMLVLGFGVVGGGLRSRRSRSAISA